MGDGVEDVGREGGQEFDARDTMDTDRII